MRVLHCGTCVVYSKQQYNYLIVNAKSTPLQAYKYASVPMAIIMCGITTHGDHRITGYNYQVKGYCYSYQPCSYTPQHRALILPHTGIQMYIYTLTYQEVNGGMLKRPCKCICHIIMSCIIHRNNAICWSNSRCLLLHSSISPKVKCIIVYFN